MLRIVWGGHYLVILNHNGTFMMFWPTTNWHYRIHVEIGWRWFSHFGFIFSLWGYWLASSYYARYFSFLTMMPLGFYCSMAWHQLYIIRYAWILIVKVQFWQKIVLRHSHMLVLHVQWGLIYLHIPVIDLGHFNNIPAMQFFTGISRHTQSKSCRLSLTQCVWEFRNNALWATH